MSSINQSYVDRVRYTLQNKNIGSVVVIEPIGWGEDEKEYVRDNKYHGVFVKMSNNLKFIENGYDCIKFIYNIGGINEDIRLIKEEKHPITDIWTRVYDGFLDMSTYVEENNSISVKFNSGGIEAMLKAREKEAIELTRETTLDGKVIEPLKIEQVEIDGREIFLDSKWDARNMSGVLEIFSDDGNIRTQEMGVVLDLVQKSHEEASSSLLSSLGGTTGAMFFLKAEVNRSFRLVIKDLIMSYRVTARDYVDVSNFAVRIVRYDESYNNLGFEDLYLALEPNNSEYITISMNYDKHIDLLKGQSLAVIISVGADFINKLFNRQRLYITYNFGSGTVEILEDSFFEKSISDVLLPHEAADRLIEVYTGQKALYSNALGRTDIGYEKDGIASLNGLLNGFMIRQFKPDDELFKPLTTSLSDFMESFSAVWRLGLGIEKIGFRERVRIEDLGYFYNLNTTIRLPNQVKNVKRSIDISSYYSNITVGYEKGGDYEEAFGLDEYNGKSNFTTIISKIKSEFNRISKYRADSYGLEFARRKDKMNYSRQDTRYDTDVFILDLKRGIGNIFNIRKWRDDLLKAPEGTYSPETAYNLRLSPLNILFRHGWEIAAGLTKYATDYVRYASSTASSRLKTQVKQTSGGNGIEYAENGDIVNSELQRAKYVPEFVEFEHVVDFDLSQKLDGKTLILGNEIMNVYGCVEYINENNETEKGFLMTLKPNGVGKWKVLKVNR